MSLMSRVDALITEAVEESAKTVERQRIEEARIIVSNGVRALSEQFQFDTASELWLEGHALEALGERLSSDAKVVKSILHPATETTGVVLSKREDRAAALDGVVA